MTATHDVLVVGGGLVGASLAIALEGSGLDVAMVEAAPAAAMPPVFDERNLSFAEATVNALRSLGVMQRLRAPTGWIDCAAFPTSTARARTVSAARTAIAA